MPIDLQAATVKSASCSKQRHKFTHFSHKFQLFGRYAARLYARQRLWVHSAGVRSFIEIFFSAFLVSLHASSGHVLSVYFAHFYNNGALYPYHAGTHPTTCHRRLFDSMGSIGAASDFVVAFRLLSIAVQWLVKLPYSLRGSYLHHTTT